MEDKTLESSWKITPEAARLISKLIVSCHELALDSKSEAFVCKTLEKKNNIDKTDFLAADKGGLYERLIRTADGLKKKTIDEEAVLRYFGGKGHEEVSLEEIGFERDLPVVLQIMLLVHMLLPVKIIGQTTDGLVGEYANLGKKVILENMLVFKEDLGKDLLGKIVLFHYAPVVCSDPEPELIQDILEEQKECPTLMDVLDKLNGKKIRISKFSKGIKRTLEQMEL